MKNRGHIMIKVAAAVGFAVTLYSIINQQFELNKLNEQYEKLEQQVESYSDSVDELSYELSICDKPGYYERVARKLGYYNFGETVFLNDRKE